MYCTYLLRISFSKVKSVTSTATHRGYVWDQTKETRDATRIGERKKRGWRATGRKGTAAAASSLAKAVFLQWRGGCWLIQRPPSR
jgi:hypothetical protein